MNSSHQEFVVKKMLLQAQLLSLKHKTNSTTLLYGPNSLGHINFNEKDIHLLNLKLETQLTINVTPVIIYVYLVY